jgi:Flp pilus assembly protein TadD
VRKNSFRRGGWVLVFWALSGAGCQHNRPAVAGLSAPDEARVPVLEARKAADIQVALGRTLEQGGDLEQAQAAYLEALKQDPRRGDACARLAVLHDRQAKWPESEEFYRRAHDLEGDSPGLLCNRGYSFYLQGRWEDAETSLRQAIALDPANQRAHNNLGLVLARSGRADEARAEFRRAGCSEAEAQTNLALALALEGSWDEARAHYDQALTLDPNSVQARRGLRDLDALTAKLAHAPEALPRNDPSLVPREE